MSNPTRQTPQNGSSVIVVGGGVTGILSAVALAEAGFSVTLVEKAKIGNGSSQRSAAAIRAQFSTPDTVLGMIYSKHWYVHMHDHLCTNNAEADAGITQNGYLWLYEEPDCAAAWQTGHRQQIVENWQRAQNNASMQQALGLPVEVIQGYDEIMQRFPHIDGDLAYGLTGATFCPTDGFLQPNLIYQHGAQRARELGVKILTSTAVIGSVIVSGKICGLAVLSNGQQQTLPCDMVVNATNAWAARTSHDIGGMHLPISPLKRYLGFCHRPSAFPQEEWNRMPFTVFGLGPGRVAYSRPDAGALMMGWAHNTEPHHDFTDEDQDKIEPGFGHADGAHGEPYVEAMRQQVMHFAPRTVEKRAKATTCGYYGTTPDHNPIIGWDTHLSGLLHCAGFSGHGLMHAPISALLVAAMMQGTTVEVKENGTTRPAIILPEPCAGKHLFIDTFAPDREFEEGEHGVL